MEQELVGSANGPQELSILGEVDLSDKRPVCFADGRQAVSVIDVVDVNVVVVGTDGQFASVRAVSDDLDPLLGVLGLEHGLVELAGALSDLELAVVQSDGDVAVCFREGDASGLLIWRQNREG